MSEALGQAFVDALHDKQSALFDWLTKLSAVYVTACSLGLDPDAQRQIRSVIRDIDLFLDTDVVLSLFGDAEPSHSAISELVRSWRAIGGKVYVIEDNVGEVVYHAGMAEAEMRDIWPEVTKYSDVEASRLISTVFVRAFRKISHGRMTQRGWHSYISNFRGSNNADYSKTTRALREENIEVVEATTSHVELTKLVSKELFDIKTAQTGSGERIAHIRDKSDRDGKIVATLVAHREQKHGSDGTAIIVSSSGILASVCCKHLPMGASLAPVMPPAAVAIMLTLMPGVAMSTASLRQLLFDPGFAEQLGPLEKRALKIIQASTEYSLPYSRRHALRDALRKDMGKVALQRGQPQSVIEDELLAPDNAEFMRLVALNVDAMTISRTEEKNRELAAENEELKRQIEIIKQRKNR